MYSTLFTSTAALLLSLGRVGTAAPLAQELDPHGAHSFSTSFGPGHGGHGGHGGHMDSGEYTWPRGVDGDKFLDWSTFQANGANLGAWLEKEKMFDPHWWNMYSPETNDEWSFCEALGDQCGPVLEARYASFINTSTVDSLAAAGVNLLRIVTHYAAWVRVPASQLYTGNQAAILHEVATYAIEKYGMHIIVGIHSLPGGINTLGIGEADGHVGWFFNETNLDYSLQAVDAVLDFIANSGHINAYSISPINEPANNFSFATGGFNEYSLTDDGATWVAKYMSATLERIAKVDKRIPLVLQDGFKGEKYWSQYYTFPEDNVVIDTHIYFFLDKAADPYNMAPVVCPLAQIAPGNSELPVFIGEWTLLVAQGNALAARKANFDIQRSAWLKYTQGSAFWTSRSDNTTNAYGDGTQRDYRDYVLLAEEGIVSRYVDAGVCD